MTWLRYRLAALTERCGPVAGLPNVFVVLATDCPPVWGWQFSDTCGAGRMLRISSNSERLQLQSLFDYVLGCSSRL